MRVMRRLLGLGFLLAAVGGGACSDRAVQVSNVWVRAALDGQDATGAYFTVTSGQAVSLIGASSSAAEIIEIHEVKMEGDVMRMRKVEQLRVTPGTTLELKPGSYHLMMMVLPKPIHTGETVGLTLHFVKPDGVQQDVLVKAAVR